jgi:alpha-D-ribose 1-methylphosphonate 5-phosphate C-P lyase
VETEPNRGGVPGLGRYHPSDACAFCGARYRVELEVCVVKSTGARALRCTDVVACQRRFHRRKQLRLFGKGAA